jgi:DNA-binding response OmpR family regulator
VLVVNGDRDLREAIIDLLADEGYDVTSAETALRSPSFDEPDTSALVAQYERVVELLRSPAPRSGA